MDTIKVDKAKLRETLQANRTKHIAEYKKAYKKWQKLVVKTLTERLAEAKEGKINLHFELPKPASYEKQYDTALEKLDWELMDEVELDEQEFEQYVQDNWRWKQAFIANSSLYK